MLSTQARCVAAARRAYSSCSSSAGLRLPPSGLRPGSRITRSPSTLPPCILQRRFAGSEPTKVTEDDQLDQTRTHRGEGAIMAVQSGLFKLLLPLPDVPVSSLAKRLAPSSVQNDDGSINRENDNGVLFLLHPKQPISMIATLIQSEISSKENQAPLEVTFHGANEPVPSSSSNQKAKPTTPQWAQSTELGDFVQEAAKDRQFVIAIRQPLSNNDTKDDEAKLIKVRVPSFEERTLYLRRRLVEVTKEMQSLLDIKSECDALALKGARRMAVAGFGGLLSYWGGVYFLTFHVYGWDLMEPVTYLTGLTGLMGGYLWFLFHQKEISYRSAFEMSTSKRREQLYDAKGFDRDKWKDLIDEGTELRRAIKKIALDYSTDWSMHNELEDAKAADEITKYEKGKFGKDAIGSGGASSSKTSSSSSSSSLSSSPPGQEDKLTNEGSHAARSKS